MGRVWEEICAPAQILYVLQKARGLWVRFSVSDSGGDKNLKNGRIELE